MCPYKMNKAVIIQLLRTTTKRKMLKFLLPNIPISFPTHLMHFISEQTILPKPHHWHATWNKQNSGWKEDRRLAWCNFLYKGIHDLVQKEKTAAFKSKHTSKIVQEYLHKFTSTEEFRKDLQMSFCAWKITEAIQSIVIVAVLYMKDFFFNHLANSSTKATAPTTQCSLTEAELAKIRYAGGMCWGSFT